MEKKKFYRANSRNFYSYIFAGGQRQKRLKYTFRMIFRSYLMFHLPLNKVRW